MSRYPIEQQNGCWTVWSMPVEHTIGRDHSKLDKFETYGAAMTECSRRMLAQCEADGTADQPMSMPGWLVEQLRASGLRPETRREYYSRDGCGGAPLPHPIPAAAAAEVVAQPGILLRLWLGLKALVERFWNR